jgi:hypothetical protein
MELEIDGAWVDVTADVRAAGTQITHTRGRREGASRTDPAAASFILSSPGGRYSTRNPRSPYFGKLGPNTRARCTVVGPKHVALNGAVGDYAYTEDDPDLDITGDIDIRFDADLSNWTSATANLSTVEYMAKLGFNAGEKSWLLGSRDGSLYIEWSADGANTLGAKSTEMLAGIVGRRAVRVTLDVDNGSGGWTVTFYTADTIAGPWIEFGNPVTGAGVTSLFNSPTRLRIGDASPITFARATGRCFAAEVRNGIDGPAVADPDFTAQALGAAGFVDSAGRAWSMNGTASISDRWPRFVLSVPEWPPSWHVSGHNVTADLTAAGTLRRLGQGQKALDSTLRRRIPSFGPLAYWPMEDEADAGTAASPIAGVPAMFVQNFDFASDDTLAGSKPLPTVDRSTGQCLMQGRVPAPGTTLDSWAVVWMYHAPEPNATLATIMRTQSTGTVREWFLQIRSDVSRVFGLDADGNTVFTVDVATGEKLFRQWVRVDFSATQNGGNVDWHVGWQPVGSAAGATSGSFAGTVGAPSTVGGSAGGFSSQLDGMAMGHVSVWPTSSSSVGPFALFSAADAWTGETAGERVERLADEEGLPIGVAGTASMQQRMGPQRPATLLELLEECEATDGGILYEDRESTGLRYRDRASLYNQTPKLVIPYGQLAPPLTPVDDDQQIRNDVTRQRIGGSSARVVVEDGPLSVDAVGLYDESVSLSMHDDTQPLQIAAWAAYLGTWDEPRYPSVRILLHKYPALIADVLALDVGDTIRITDLPIFLPPGPVDLMVMGYREDIGPRTWEVTLFCTPAGPWSSLGVVDESHADTTGSQLVITVDEATTAVPVVTTLGPRWVDSATYPDDFPFDVTVGGEAMTVTACTGVVEDAFDDAVASGWGTADSGQAWTADGGSASDYAVSGGTGRLLLPAATFLAQVAAVSTADVDLRVDFSLPVAPTGDSAYVYPVIRYADGTHFYFARVQITATGGMFLNLRKRVGSETLLDSYATGMTLTAGAWYTVRLTVTGSDLAAKVWLRSDPEPTDWQVSATDTDLTDPESVGVRGFIGGSTTNAMPFTMEFDNLRADPQTFTVTRSVNGIVKSHAAGADIRLAHPSYVAL